MVKAGEKKRVRNRKKPALKIASVQFTPTADTEYRLSKVFQILLADRKGEKENQDAAI